MKVLKLIQVFTAAALAVLLLWSPAGADESSNKGPVASSIANAGQTEETNVDAYAYWREWFELHRDDADLNPLPQWTPPRMEMLGESNVVLHDPLTGETQEGSLRDLFPNSFDAQGKFIPFGESREDEQNPLDEFTVGEIIDDPSGSPWKVNCKLYISANGGVGQGSGILIDGNHVLTAGHCVYNIDLNAWVDMIEVIPAFDEGNRPYGTSYSAGYLAWTGWTVNEDWNWDLAVIKLNRPVGAITGWFPYGYNADNNWYYINTFHSTGYPGGPPFDGVRLNYRSGPFDSANANILYELDTTSYGGMSGGGVYYRQTLSYRIVHAVASHGYGGFGGFNRVTQTKYNGITAYVSGNRSSLPDIAALGCTVSPQLLETGDLLDSLFFYLYNTSDDTFVNADIPVTLYLSTNRVISSADMSLATRVFMDVDLNPGESRKMVWASPPLVPWNVSSGWKWYGVILNYGDGNTDNNASSYDDADSVYIQLVPPGQAGNPSPSNGSTNISVGANLTWMNGPGATSHNVYWGESNPPPFRVNQTSAIYDPAVLWPGHAYYWRIDEVNAAGTTTGLLWSFTTTYPDPPGAAGDPVPANGAVNVPVNVECLWSAGAGYTEEFDVYFGTTNPPPFIQTQALQTYDPPGNLAYDRLYYWKIVARNPSGEIGSSLWHFTTIMQEPEAASNPTPANGATNVLISANLLWTQGARTINEDLFFGTTNPPPYVGREDYDGFYNPQGDLAELTPYYWQIRENNTGGQTMGPLWSFMTAQYFPPPGLPSNPAPPNEALNVSTLTSLAFSPGTNTVSHQLWFFDYDAYYLYWAGTDTIIPNSAFGPLEPNTYYSWKITEVNEHASTLGPPWFFTTGGVVETGPPSELTIQIVQSFAPSIAVLRWSPAVNGYWYYVHRTTDVNFVPGPANVVATVWDTTWTDTSVLSAPDLIRYYMITAGP